MKNSLEKPVVAVVIATGIASVITQLVLIREFLSQFQGNEVIIALILFSWLVLGGIGTLSAQMVGRTGREATWNALAWLSLGLACFAVSTVLGARLLRDVFFIRGSSVGFYSSFFYVFAIMAPYALQIGFILPFSLFVLKSRLPRYPGALVYIWDNFGDVAGAGLFAFLLVFWLTPLQAVCAAHLPLLTVVVFGHRPASRQGLALTAAAAVVFLILLGGVLAEKSTLSPSQGRLAEYRETRYGRLTVVQQEGQYTLFQDGRPSISSQSDVVAEESVHYALAQVEIPRSVLLISVQGGMLAELAKYALDRIDYVELDSEVSEMLFRFGIMQPVEGLRVIHRDARAYLADTAISYDAILVNLRDPDTFQTNRFYTDRFFELARRRLTDHGVLSFSMEGFENYLAEPQRRKFSSLFNTATHYFRHVLMLPGQRVYFLCSDRRLQSNIVAILADRGVPTLYISAYFDGDVTPERISYLRGLMDPEVPLNSELSPYLMRTAFAEWFFKFGASPAWFIAAVTALLGLYLLFIRRLEFVLFSTGWMVMGSEILIIFAFQIFFGYIYFQIGVIVTVFLAGMLPGAWLGRKLVRQAARVLALTDIALIGLLGVILAGVHFGDRLPASGYLAMGFAISLACGLQFPAALHLRADTGAAATGMFSADLIGAAFGTLATSTVLIPYLGILGALGGLIALKLISLYMTVPLHEGSFAKTVSG